MDKTNPKNPTSQWHVHDRSTDAGYNLDGTVHDGHKGFPQFSRKTIKWLNDNGFNIPNK